MKEIFNRKNLVTLILMFIAAVGITVSMILFTPKYLMVLPLYVSLFISLLQTRINRYAPLIGGINSILYFVVYMYSGIPATAFYALFFSCPLQIITFIRWTKNKRGSTTLLRKMTWKVRLWVALTFAAAWAAVFAVSTLAGSDFAILDTTSSMLGILTTFMTMFAFIEYTVLQLVGGVTSISLYVNMIASGRLEQMPFLVYSVYSLICVCLAVIRAKRLYEEQRKESNAA
ncbi:MAG: nicotinamide mononucleotide transporter [Ruminococcaceae bacterium]|nr:nicotinamide mononucleotide transporter [Oscillospiraceae bacterium]